jgi:hypothetical protein
MTTNRKMVVIRYCLPNGANMLVFSVATTWYGDTSGSGSTGWRFMTRASVFSTARRAWSCRPLASSQRGDSGIRKYSATATMRFRIVSVHRNHR